MTNEFSVGAQGVAWSIMGLEATTVIFDLRWMLVLSFILVCTDFWWGWAECKMHYECARKISDKAGMDKYKFRLSRAGRRSMNKLIDYVTYLLVGAVLGLAIFEPLKISNHVVTGAVGLGLGCLFDVSSIVGHICAIHHIPKIQWNVRGIFVFIGHFVAALLKRKDVDVGEALDETIDNNNNNSK